MQLRFLGNDSKSGGSPTLYASDHGTYVVQGWRTDTANTIEIPHGLIRHLQPDTCLGALLHDTGHGTFTLTGRPVTDSAALAQLKTPDHETSVEVPVGQEIRPDATPRG
ncbi:hypothetical protein ACQPW1_02420 [Nocardia sp. CA-128927]|uniref:hypothetical protein n=1 Tax=Nocardia sp. CA-128927 TaxID=3239975 RepID=UPI003D95D0AD